MAENEKEIYETEVLEEDMNTSDKMDFYKKFRQKVDKFLSKHPNIEFANYIAAVPDVFYLLVRLSTDDRVGISPKFKLGAAIVYTISPIDIIPDFIPGVGWLDDLIICATLLNRALDEIDPNIVDEYWLSDGKVYDFIKSVLDKGDKLVGSKAWNSIKKFLSEKIK